VRIAQNGPPDLVAAFLLLVQDFEPECRFAQEVDFANIIAPLIVKERLVSVKRN